MFDVFGSVKGLLKLDTITIDNNVFKLHYKATVIILIAFSLLVTSRQYIGDPIDCIVEEIPSNVMDTYCWIHSTYTIYARHTGTAGIDFAHPGVGTEVGEERTYHKYYQWVCFVLFFQAILFYIPRYLWKNWEGGRLRMLVQDLTGPMVEEGARKDRCKLLVEYFTNNLHTQNYYAYKFFFCEVLNLVNVILQIYFIDFFLGGTFTSYGPSVVSQSIKNPEDRADPMNVVFPKVTKCEFHKFGPSGTVQKFDGLCVLPLNIVNEKIYIFLWFWFVILSIITGCAIIYRICTIAFEKLRHYQLKTKCSLSNQQSVNTVARKCFIGDWFVLYFVCKNMDPLTFKEVISELSRKLEGKDIV